MYKIYDFLFLMFLLLFGTLIIAAFIVNVWMPYQAERKYIKMEISRNRDEKREYWKQALRNFYIRHIPIIGRFLVKRRRKH